MHRVHHFPFSAAVASALLGVVAVNTARLLLVARAPVGASVPVSRSVATSGPAPLTAITTDLPASLFAEITAVWSGRDATTGGEGTLQDGGVSDCLLRKLDITYGFVSEAHPWCVWGWDGGVGEVGGFALVAGMGS